MFNNMFLISLLNKIFQPSIELETNSYQGSTWGNNVTYRGHDNSAQGIHEDAKREALEGLEKINNSCHVLIISNFSQEIVRECYASERRHAENIFPYEKLTSITRKFQEGGRYDIKLVLHNPCVMIFKDSNQFIIRNSSVFPMIPNYKRIVIFIHNY